MEGVSRAGQRASSLLGGIMEVRTGPPRLVSTLKTYYHPISQKTVVLHPLPNVASPRYLRRVLYPATLLAPHFSNSGNPIPKPISIPPPSGAADTNEATSETHSGTTSSSTARTGDPNGASTDGFSSPSSSSVADPNNAIAFDKILCEDGQLPYPHDAPKAYWQQLLQLCLPFLRVRQVVSREWGNTYYDGLVQRDGVESRMAFEMLRDEWRPPVDPRARRAMERILHTYPEKTRVCVPWSPYHIPYFIYRLELEGFELIKKEEVEVMGFRWLVYGLVGSIVISFYMLVKAITYVFRW